MTLYTSFERELFVSAISSLLQISTLQINCKGYCRFGIWKVTALLQCQKWDAEHHDGLLSHLVVIDSNLEQSNISLSIHFIYMCKASIKKAKGSKSVEMKKKGGYGEFSRMNKLFITMSALGIIIYSTPNLNLCNIICHYISEGNGWK